MKEAEWDQLQQHIRDCLENIQLLKSDLGHQQEILLTVWDELYDLKKKGTRGSPKRDRSKPVT